MEKKLRFLNKKLLASFVLIGALSSRVNAANNKKTIKSQQDASEVTVEQAFFDEAKIAEKKKTTLNANVGAMVTIGNDGRDELGHYSQLNFNIPMGKNFTFTPGIEVLNTQYSALGMDKTTDQVLLNAGLQWNAKNGNYINLGAKGGFYRHVTNTFGLYNNTDVLYRSMNNHIVIGPEITIGQIGDTKKHYKKNKKTTFKRHTKEITVGVQFDCQNGNKKIGVRGSEGFLLGNDSQINFGIGVSYTIEK